MKKSFNHALKHQLGSKINAASASCSLHQAEIGISQRGIRVAEVRCIGGAEPLGAKLSVESFRQLHLSEEMGIKLEEVRASEHVTTHIPECRLAKEHGGICKNQGVKPGLGIDPLQFCERSADPGRLAVARSIE